MDWNASFAHLLPIIASTSLAPSGNTNDVAAPVVEAGDRATELGLARWCQGCGLCRLHTDMRWTIDGLYRCRSCLGNGVGSPELWVSTLTMETIRG